MEKKITQWELYYIDNQDEKRLSVKTYDDLKKSGMPCIKSEVPSCFERDLFNAKIIPDPYYSDNIFELRKYETYHQYYFAKFDAENGENKIIFGGIDTVADIIINGQFVAHTENMFLEYEFCIPQVKEKDNEVIVHIYPAVLESRKYKITASAFAQKYNYGSLSLRKSASTFGWDILPRIICGGLAKNIQHSLKCYQYGGHFRALYDLYEKNELTSSINRVVEDVNHRFTFEVLTRDFISHDLGISARNLRNDRKTPNDILDRIDKEEFTKRLKNLLEIRNKEEQTVTISEEHRREIKEYLDALDLTVDIDIQTLPVGREKNYKTVFTQPGMRYSQAKELVQSLLEDGEFQELSIDERNAVIERILSDIKGRMMEDIVLLETKIANPKKQVFQLQFAVGEFDMVVADNANATCEIYEVKHSKEQAKEQFRHLIDEEKLKNTEFRYGKITKRTVIYRGENATLKNGIEYRNVEDYLKSLL